MKKSNDEIWLYYSMPTLSNNVVLESRDLDYVRRKKSKIPILDRGVEKVVNICCMGFYEEII